MCRFAINGSTLLLLAVFASSLLLADSVIANLEEGLMVYFSFDQGETDMVRDLSNTGNDGIVKGEPRWVDGPAPAFGEGIEFDGVDDYIEVPDNDTLDVGEGDISFMLWLKQADDQPADHPRPISKMPLYATDKPGFDLITFGKVSQAMQIFYGMSGATRQTTNAVRNIVDGEWHHIATMKDDKEIKLYIDGEMDSSKPITEVDISNDYPFVVGACAQVAAHVMFKGAVDEVAFYNRALTEDEIQMAMKDVILSAVEPETKLSTTWGDIKRGY